jgi:hypothetical protein
VGSSQVADGSLGAGDLAPPEPWNEVGPGSGSSNLCVDPANTAIFCSLEKIFGYVVFVPWSNYDPGYATAAFYKDQLGIVHLRGLVGNTGWTAQSSPFSAGIFRLPTGYRPETTRLFTTNGRTLDLEVAQGRIDVRPDGMVNLVSDCTASIPDGCAAAGEFISLDGISFRPDE